MLLFFIYFRLFKQQQRCPADTVFKIVPVKQFGRKIKWLPMNLTINHANIETKKLAFATSALLSCFRINFPGQWHQVTGSALGYPGDVQWTQDVSTNVLTLHFVSLQLHSLCEPCESKVEFDSHWRHPVNNVKKRS